MASAERVADDLQFLSAYQTATEQLLEVFVTNEPLPDLERLQQLLVAREQLIEVHKQLPERQAETPAVQEKVQVIRQLEEQVETKLTNLRQNLVGKMNDLQQQKRGLGAYRSNYSIGAAFIDSKK